MAKTLTFDIDNFKAGLVLLEDDSMAPVGSARVMNNAWITDRGGISPRPGTMMLGEPATASDRGRGFYVFKKAFGSLEIPMSAFGEGLWGYHQTAGWFLIKADYTNDQEFGFVSNLVNSDNDDFVYFCNRYEAYQRWSGEMSLLTVALAGGETTITVDSTLDSDSFYTSTVKAAPAPTTTTFDVDAPVAAPWANDQWNTFTLYMTSGAQAGQTRTITATTTTGITFDALPGAPVAGDTFEIRKSKFNLTYGSTFMYNGTEIEVTAVPSATELTVASAHAAPIGAVITQSPQEYTAAPRGNRMDTLLGRMTVANVRSALTLDSGGGAQGYNSAGAVFFSARNDPTTFLPSEPRLAGEGVQISVPYGGGDITDVALLEDVMYVYKRQYIEAVKFTNDIDDVTQRVPVKSGAGSLNKVIKGKDDHYFITVDKQFTSIGRVESKDVTVQTANIGLPIRRLLQELEYGDFDGVEFQNRILFSAKESADSANNDVTIVWNKRTQSFEGAWNVGAHGFDIYNEQLYYQEAYGPNVWKMFEERKADVVDGEDLPIAMRWQSSFYNLLPIKGNLQTVQSIAFEGYIAANAEFTFSLYKDFQEESSIQFTFGGVDDEQFLLGSELASFLGSNPLGLQPLGALDEPGADGRRRFSFMVYFPYLYGQYFSLGFDSSGIDQDWEIIRASLGLRETISTIRPGIKSI